ncbi:MAG: cytochrome c [Halioglobus sp.]
MLFQRIHKTVLLALCLTGAGASASVSEQRQQELIYLLHQDCGSCHGMTLKGGLGPSLLPAALKSRPDDYLRHVIAKGVPEQAMPPWEAILSAEDIDFLVQHLTRRTDVPEMNQ